jgi:uncharacterized protein YjdB
MTPMRMRDLVISRTLVALCAATVAMASAGCGRSGLRGFEAAPGDAGSDGIDIHKDAGSDGLPPPVDARVAQSLTVAPASASLTVGSGTTFTATVRYNDGVTADVTGAAAWTSSDTSVATVGAGRVLGVGGGGAVITATYAGLSAMAKVSVTGPTTTLTSIAIVPPAQTVVVGTTIVFRVIGTYSNGTTADVTSMTSFKPDRPDLLSPGGGAVFKAVAAGTARVTAGLGMFSAVATVQITGTRVVSVTISPPGIAIPVGTTFRFTATAQLSDGTTQDVTASATWTSSDPSVVASLGSGLVMAERPGGVALSATFGGVTGVAMLGVTGAQLVSLEIDPVDPSLGVGVAVSFSAIGVYNDGSRADLTASVMWSSSSPNVVSIDGGGNAVTRAAGTSVIVATNGMVKGSSTVTVTSISLQSLSVIPPNVTLTVGGTAALRALGTFSDGSTVDLTTSVVWSSSSQDVAFVDPSSGLVTALAPGSAAVTATFGTVSGAAKVLVSPATIAAIVIVPAASSVPVGATESLSAIGFFSDGSTRDVTDEVSWSSSSNGIATITNGMGAGIVTGVQAGDVTITASSGSASGTATVTVLPATLQQIDVEPANAMTTAGLRSNYTATGMYSDGSKADLTTQVTWTTSDTTVATISNVAGAQGQLLARAAGSTTVIATFGSVTGSTTVIVTGRAPIGLAISPLAVSTPAGIAVQYAAVELFNDGTQRNVSGMAMWTSSNPMVARIDPTGRAVAVAPGTTTIQATFMGFTASTTLTVTAAVLTSLQLTPLAPTLAVGAILRFTAQAVFSDGSTNDVTTMATWVSSNPMALGVDTAAGVRGRATALAPGMSTVTASFMGLSSSTVVTVTP